MLCLTVAQNWCVWTLQWCKRLAGVPPESSVHLQGNLKTVRISLLWHLTCFMYSKIKRAPVWGFGWVWQEPNCDDWIRASCDFKSVPRKSDHRPRLTDASEKTLKQFSLRAVASSCHKTRMVQRCLRTSVTCLTCWCGLHIIQISVWGSVEGAGQTSLIQKGLRLGARHQRIPAGV